MVSDLATHVRNSSRISPTMPWPRRGVSCVSQMARRRQPLPSKPKLNRKFSTYWNKKYFRRMMMLMFSVKLLFLLESWPNVGHDGGICKNKWAFSHLIKEGSLTPVDQRRLFLWIWHRPLSSAKNLFQVIFKSVFFIELIHQIVKFKRTHCCYFETLRAQFISGIDTGCLKKRPLFLAAKKQL